MKGGSAERPGQIGRPGNHQPSEVQQRKVHLGWGNPGCTGRLGNEMLESRTVQRDLGIMVDGKLHIVSTALAARGHIPVLRGTRPSMAIQAREGLSHSALLWGGLTSRAGGSLGTTI